MSIVSVLVTQLEKALVASVAGTLAGSVKDAVASAIASLVGKLPTEDDLAARLLGNPRLKAWLVKQPASDQAAVKRAATIMASCALESILKLLKKV